MSLDEHKKQMIEKLILGLQAEGKFIQQDNTKTSEEKLMEVEVLIDTTKFLKNYEQNVKILNSYLAEHRWEIIKQQDKERQKTKEEKERD